MLTQFRIGGCHITVTLRSVSKPDAAYLSGLQEVGGRKLMMHNKNGTSVLKSAYQSWGLK